MSAKHTPGPWKAKQLGSFSEPGWVIVWPDKGGTHMRRLDYQGNFTEQDARLISAAPELLAVAQLLALATDEGDDLAAGTHYVDKTGRIRCKGSFLETIEKARAAITKATEERP